MASQDLTVRLNADTGQFERGFKSAEASARAFEREMAKVEAAQTKARNAMSQVGTATLTAGGIIAAGLGMAAKAAMDWESAWAGVRKTVDGSPEEMAALEQELRGLATTLPATHEEIAGVAEAAGQLGIERGSIASFTKTMIDLGETTNLSADEAATALAQFMNVMGTASGDVDRLGSTVVALGNAGASTEAEIVSMAQRIAGAGRLVGATEGEVLALASAMADVGISAELGGGVISRVMQRIYAASKEGGDAIEGFAEVAGMSAQEFATAFREDPVQALNSFIQGLGGVESAGGNVIGTLGDLGIKSTEEVGVLLRLKGAGDGLTEALGRQAQAWQENTALVDEANQRYQTTEARLQIARNQLNDTAISIGGVLLPALTGAAERVGALAEAFNALPAPVQQGVTALGAVAAAAGTLGGAALILIPKLAELHGALETMGPRGATAARGLSAVGGVLTGPWGLAIAGATLALGVWAERQYQAAQRVDELAATLDSQTGAITENTRARVVQRLEEEGALEAAQRLGISLEMVTDAALLEADAMRGVTDATAEGVQTQMMMNGVMVGAGTSLKQYGEDTRTVREAVFGQSEETRKAVEQAQRMAQAQGEGSAANKDATTTTEGFTQAQGDAASATEIATDAIDDLIKSMNELNGVGLSAIEAEIGWQEALAGTTKALADNGRSLDITTEKGRANQGALNDMAKAGAELAETILRETGSEARMRTSLDASRRALHETAVRFGMTEDEARAYVDRVLSVPSAATTDVRLRGAADALWNLDQVLSRVIRLDGRQVVVTVTTRNVQTGRVSVGTARMEAEGGYISGPGTATSDSIPAWLSNGEYVVNARQTAKFRPVLEAINAGRVQRFADGGPVGSPLLSPVVSVDAPNVAVYVQAVPDGPWVRSQARVVIDDQNRRARDGRR